MHMKKIVVYSELPASLLARLRERFEVTYFAGLGAHDHPAFAAALRDAHGMLGVGIPVGRALLEQAAALQAIATISVGYDNFDLEYLRERGISLSNTPDVLSEATADAIFALLLATARRIVELAEWVKAGNWRGSIGRSHYGIDVYSKTLGVLGMGRIGQAVARRARLGFSMRIVYFNRRPVPRVDEELDARQLPLDGVLSEADFVCVVLPLTKATERLIGVREFSLMKPSAVFINAARGRIVEEGALIDALRNRKIHAAGLDVFEREPLPIDSPLLQMANVVALPHIGSATHETRDAMARLAVENMIAAFEGRPQNLVSLDA